MYVRTIRCPQDHLTESDFGSAAALEENIEKLKKAGMYVCPCCGSDDLKILPASPRVNRGAKADTSRNRWRYHALPRTSDHDDVGAAFIKESLAMHRGEAPFRPLTGTASSADIKRAVQEEGVPLFVPKLDS